MDPRIELVISTIEKSFSDDLDTQKLGEMVNMSASYLRHVFKSETGLTPRQYLKRVRMQEAQILLRTTFLSVKQIMNHVGINDDSYFSREFRRTFGIAPGKYRKLQQRLVITFYD